MGWWTDPVGSKPKGRSTKAKSPPKARGEVVATTKPGRAERHDVCGKSGKACKCFEVGDAIPTRRGTPKAQADRVDADGRIWCPCGGLTHKGVCMDITCSTRKGA